MSFKEVDIIDSSITKGLFTEIRNRNTPRENFIKKSDRLMRILVEYALTRLPYTKKNVETPCGTYNGIEHNTNICAVSIVRSGDILVEAMRQVEPSISVGKILIQRNEESENKEAKLFYHKLPKNIYSQKVFLCDPLLATGGSALCAIKVLLENGVIEENIYFLNLIAAPQGLNIILESYPKIKIITGEIDIGLNSDKFVVPGLGDFGDIYYNTL